MNHLPRLIELTQLLVAFELSAESVLSDAELVETQRRLAEGRRRLDALSARSAAMIARRSRPELGHDGLAQRTGARTPQALVQQITGLSKREASALVAVGGLMDVATVALEAPPVAAWLAVLGEAVHSGKLSTNAAGVIRGTLAGLAVAEDVLVAAVTELIAKARVVDVDRLAVEARQVRDELDAAGVAAREDELRDKRWVRLYPQASGMTRIAGELDPESAALIVAVVDAGTSPRRGGPRFVDPAGRARQKRIVDDPRTIEQLTVDTLVDVVRVGLSGDVKDMVGTTPPEVRIHVTATDLNRGVGAAHIEGQTAAVSVQTAMRQACTAGVIPILFDDRGQVLNLGRSQRLFSRRQRIALAARDRGCRFPGCDRPPGWCEAHHINEWDRDHGRTDVADGVLLCRHHHMLVHNNGWRVDRSGGDYVLVPPRSEDPAQRPIVAPAKGVVSKRAA